MDLRDAAAVEASWLMLLRSVSLAASAKRRSIRLVKDSSIWYRIVGWHALVSAGQGAKNNKAPENSRKNRGR